MTQRQTQTAFDIDDDEFGIEFDTADEFESDRPSDTGRAALEAVDFDPMDLDEPSAPPPASHPVGHLMATAEAAFGEISAPRINIHIFCQRADTTEVAERASADRRLARATTEIRVGGLQEALAYYSELPTPPLIIVECVDGPDVLLNGLDRLAECCDPGTKVIVIGAHNDVALYRELMRRGVSEYLVPPIDPLSVIRSITGLYADPATPFMGRGLAFVGAKGGVGASTIAHNVAYGLAEGVQANTVVVDYDLAFGTAGLDFNQDPIQGVADALSKPDRLDPVLLDRMIARCGERLSLFAAPASLDDDYDIAPEAFEEVTNKIRATAPYIVFDLPHLWSGWMRKTLLAADEVVIVAAPDLASLRNAKNLIEMVRRARPNDSPPQLILNQIGVPGRPEIPVKEFAKALGMDPALCVPFDAKLFGQAANNGQMICEVNPKAKASEALMEFTRLLSRREAPMVRPPTLTEKLLGKLTKK